MTPSVVGLPNSGFTLNLRRTGHQTPQMPFISPREIADKAASAYPRFLAVWIRGEGDAFFPYRVRTRLTPAPKDPQGTITASEKLLANSKTQRGWGYTVHRQQVRSRDFGNNPFPKSITIDTRDDLLKLAQATEDFVATKLVAERVRHHFPQLEEWLIKSVRSLSSVAEPLDGLIRVAQYFIDNPWPNCYARQIPVSVDTKFIERNKSVLHQWLDLLLPDSAIDINETKFSRRYGLRDGQPHRGIRLLDPQLTAEVGIPSGELSLPLRSIAELTVHDMTVFIVENDLNLLTMPLFPRGLGIRGEGNAVTRLERLKWLATNRVIYWGDIDMDGFRILSRLRNLFPHVESIMMDCHTMQLHEQFVVEGNDSRLPPPTNLTTSEVDAYDFCSQHNRRLEQEKVLQPFVDHLFAKLRDE